MTRSRFGMTRTQALDVAHDRRRQQGNEERVAFLEDYLYLRDWMPLERIAERMGIQRDSLVTRLRRYGVRP
jgi:hypothetical protein